MAAYAGLIPIDREVVAIAGSGRGVDTALLIEAGDSSQLFNTAIREIIAKPRNF